MNTAAESISAPPAVVHGPELTERERKILAYVVDFTVEHFFQPSVREICQALEIASTKSVADVVQSLVQKGYIAESRSQRGARSLNLIGVEVAVTRRLVPPPPALPIVSVPDEPAGAAA